MRLSSGTAGHWHCAEERGSYGCVSARPLEQCLITCHTLIRSIIVLRQTPRLPRNSVWLTTSEARQTTSNNGHNDHFPPSQRLTPTPQGHRLHSYRRSATAGRPATRVSYPSIHTPIHPSTKPCRQPEISTENGCPTAKTPRCATRSKGGGVAEASHKERKGKRDRQRLDGDPSRGKATI